MDIQKHNFLILLACLFVFTCFSQTIKGVVLDAKTQDPIESAAIYFDNTSIGTSSNNKGEFLINRINNSPLIISYLGYEKVILPTTEKGKFYKILLIEANNALDEVVINVFDGMPKKIKLKHFRKHFLGDTKNGKSCTILNEEDINLRYNKRTRQLVVTSKAPILVRNDNLQYDVKFDLKQFTIDYGYVNLKKKTFIANSVLYKGTTFFKSLIEDESTNEKRERVYKGSIVHFMSALATKTLKENEFKIISLGYVVDPENYIRVEKIDSSNSVNVKLRLPLTIGYKKWKQSDMRLPNKNGKFDSSEHQNLVKAHDSVIAIKRDKILNARAADETVNIENVIEIENKYYYNLSLIIDEYGNYSPLGSFYFTGYFSELRVGDTLPLDYAFED